MQCQPRALHLIPRAFVLIPGAGGAAIWYWRLVVPLLREAGHEAITVDLPGADPVAGLPEYARLVASAVNERENAVLVAQSLGGFTAPMAAAQRPVAGIVLVNAMIPVPGETPGAWWGNTGQAQARIAAAEGGGYGTEFDLGNYFLHDVPAEVAAGGEDWVEADAVFQSTCDFGAWPVAPTRVVIGAGDRFFPAEFQRRVARERLGIEADILPGGHLIALAHPESLARFLLETTTP
jgi:pimeloyl-ACP methyl ester carboxylesterase